MLMTTTNGFEGYHVDKYLGVISKDIVFRSGLGKSFSAALTNLVASFSLRDVELSGSSELIANAKDYVIQQFEQLAKSKGANAVIGIDVETSFGEALARVAINGTAVVVSPVETSIEIEEDDDSLLTISISRTNSPEGFLPVELKVLNQYGSSEIVLSLQAIDNSVPNDIIADLEFTSIFGDTQSIENVCFLGIHKKYSKYESKPVRIKLLEHIAPCIEVCAIRIRKYRQNNQLIEISDLEIRPIEKLQEILSASIVKENTDETGWIFDEEPGFIRCPNCDKRASKDYMKYKNSCPSCGFPHKKPES